MPAKVEIVDGPVALSNDQRSILNRLKRARGQLGAIINSLEDGTDCSQAITQLAAVSNAISRAGFAIISSEMRDCVRRDSSDKPAGGNPLTMSQIEHLFITLA
ncbi:metal-sensitive transcriptional regulator [soil metagenome]